MRSEVDRAPAGTNLERNRPRLNYFLPFPAVRGGACAFHLDRISAAHAMSGTSPQRDPGCKAAQFCPLNPLLPIYFPCLARSAELCLTSSVFCCKHAPHKYQAKHSRFNADADGTQRASRICNHAGGVPVISATNNAGKNNGPSAQDLTSSHELRIPVRKLPQQEAPHCFGSSAVYHCNGTLCSAFPRCAELVSPWSPG